MSQPDLFLRNELPAAEFSADMLYRHVLRRRCPKLPLAERHCLPVSSRAPMTRFDRALFCGLNPSKAGEEGTDDPTCRKFVGFAARLGFRAMSAVNLFDLISTDPDALSSSVKPLVSIDCDEKIRAEVDRSEIVIACWGAHGRLYVNRIREVWPMLSARPVYCLATAQSGHPAHPLMLGWDCASRVRPWSIHDIREGRT